MTAFGVLLLVLLAFTVAGAIFLDLFLLIPALILAVVFLANRHL